MGFIFFKGGVRAVCRSDARQFCTILNTANALITQRIMNVLKRHFPPYTQQYRFVVGKDHASLNIVDFYCRRFGFKPRTYWQGLIRNGHVTVNRQMVTEDHVLQEGEVLHTSRDDVQEPDVNPCFEIIYERDGTLVINKPAPLPVHPAGRYYKNSLLYILKEESRHSSCHTIHRLDTWTTGVLLMATERQQARYLHAQVDKRQVHKEYAVLAAGDFGNKPFVVDEPVGRLNGARRGFGAGLTDVRAAVTRFEPLACQGEVTLLKAVPLTGRTNQIRVHLNAVGGHVLNDPLYSPASSENIPFMGLHCRRMRLKILPEKNTVDFVAPWPQHFMDFFGKGVLEDFDKPLHRG